MCGVAPSAPMSREAGFARTCAVVRRIGRWTLAVDGPKKGNQVKEAGRWDKTDASVGDAPRRLEGPPWRPRSTMTPRKRSSRRTRQSLSRLRLLSPAQAAPPAATGGMTHEAMEELKQLGELHEQGVLTDEEFQREKARLLGSG